MDASNRTDRWAPLICAHCHEREVYGPDPFGTGWCRECAEEEAEYDRKVALVQPLANEFMRRARELVGDDLAIGIALGRTNPDFQIL